MAAKASHYNSPRASGPLAIINCAAIPGTLLESELFGHVKGAYAGAATSQPGRFVQAGSGTVFLGGPSGWGSGTVTAKGAHTKM